jgi:hypothetical protein
MRPFLTAHDKMREIGLGIIWDKRVELTLKFHGLLVHMVGLMQLFMHGI